MIEIPEAEVMNAAGRPIAGSEISTVDVAILGGGPAGTSTALALRAADPSRSVLVVERSRYDSDRIGETLPPDARPLLRRLGVWDEFAADGHLPAFGSRSVWGGDEPYDHEFVFRAQGHGWHLDRRRFDAMLARAAMAAGADVRTALALDDARRTCDGRWRLSLSGPGTEPRVVDAAFVVDATGRRAAFARRQGARSTRFDGLVGVVMPWGLRADGRAVDSYSLVEAWEGGWWYSSRLPGDRMITACMTDGDLVRGSGLADPARLATLLRAAPQTGGRLRGAEPLGAPSVHPAWSHRLDRFAGAGWLAVGDAASTFDPLSSQGIAKAMRSGELAASAIVEHLAGSAKALPNFGRTLGREYREYLGALLDFYAREPRWPGAPFWARRRFPLSLRPDERLVAGDPVDRPATPRRALALATADLEQLRSLCPAPRPAHEVVAAFRDGFADPPPVRMILLGIQSLLEDGALRRSLGGTEGPAGHQASAERRVDGS